MSFYEQHVLPHLLHVACGLDVVDRQRAAVVPQARGRVLEVGMGSGLNIPHYDPQRVELVWGLEPSSGMRRKARHNAAGAPFDIRWLDLPGEEIPLEDNSGVDVYPVYDSGLAAGAGADVSRAQAGGTTAVLRTWHSTR